MRGLEVSFFHRVVEAVRTFKNPQPVRPVSMLFEAAISNGHHHLQILAVRAVAVRGDRLVVEVLGSESLTLINSTDAADPEQFWRIWKQLQPAKAVWDDGLPFEP